MTISAPALLAGHHDVEGFDCGEESLNHWLERHALRNQASGASRTFVACDGQRVIGFYALAAGAVAVSAAGGRIRRNMPDPIPVVVLGRLAVDRSHGAQGLGRALVRDAAKRVLQAADSIGIRGLLVHALNDDAEAFYRALGFARSPLDPMTLMVTLSDLEANL